MEVPETRYAVTRDGVHIAYQVAGDGPLDVVLVPNWASPIDLMWDHPLFHAFLVRLTSFSRLILFDKRGSGVSDVVGVDDLPTLEAWMDDVRAVMDVVESEKAAIVGTTEGCRMAILFAATHPDRTAALVLLNGFARYTVDVDYPYGFDPDVSARAFEQGWGTGSLLRLQAPTLANDDESRRWWARFERVGNSPRMAAAVFKAQLNSDLRPVLPAIRVSTLVIQRDSTYMGPQHGRYLAAHIPHALYREMPGPDHLVFAGETRTLLDEVQEFLTGVRPLPEADRVLATILFTDIVSSTQRVSDLGDRRWRDLLDRHDRAVSRLLDAHRGQLIKTTGDGVLATFDGPARALRCASAIRAAALDLGIEIRAGLHTGEIELREPDATGDIGGIAVHIASRVVDLAEPGEILVSRTVVDLVAGSGSSFTDRGDYELRGVPGSWRLFASTA